MRYQLPFLALIGVLLSGFAFSHFASNGSSSDEAAVRAASQHYLDGHATGDGTHHQQVFHPEAKLFWVRDGELNQRTSAAYIAGASGTPAANESERKRWISNVDITGTTATARIILDYPGVYITDYMSLLKIDGEWKIVNKIFHVESKE